MDFKINLKTFQDRFVFSERKFPCMVAGVGTGKTLCLLMKIYNYCLAWPGTTALVVRKEFTDLKDSTMKDFQQYFNAHVGENKNYELGNGSMIMFRHGNELDALKNLNLGIAGIDQGEDFQDDTQMQFLRDRLRQANGAPVHPLVVIANANGHNWIWKLWINQAQEVKTIDAETGQQQFINGEYECLTATTFANADNLPPDFIADRRRLETEAPSHYRRMVLNSFEESDQDDAVFTFGELLEAKKREYAQRTGYGYRIMGFDVARYGDDKCAAVGIQQLGALIWTTFHVEQWGKTDLDTSTGRILSIARKNNVDNSIIDEDGIGSGPLDTLTKGQRHDDFQGFRNSAYGKDENKDFGNPRTAAAFALKELIAKGHIAIKDDLLIQELLTLRYKFANDGRRILVSKEELRKQGIKSPNLADALLYAVSLIDDVQRGQDRQYGPKHPTVQPDDWNPFAREPEDQFPRSHRPSRAW